MFGDEVAPGDGFVSFVLDLGRAVDLAGNFGGFFFGAADPLWMAVRTELFGGLIAIFLEHLQVPGEPAEVGDGLVTDCGGGTEAVLSFGFEQILREVGGGDLEADFWKQGGIGLADVLEEVVLDEAVFEGALLLGAPGFIAAAGFPIGNVAFGDANAVLVESIDDLFIGNVVTELRLTMSRSRKERRAILPLRMRL